MSIGGAVIDAEAQDGGMDCGKRCDVGYSQDWVDEVGAVRKLFVDALQCVGGDVVLAERDPVLRLLAGDFVRLGGQPGMNNSDK